MLHQQLGVAQSCDRCWFAHWDEHLQEIAIAADLAQACRLLAASTGQQPHGHIASGCDRPPQSEVVGVTPRLLVAITPHLKQQRQQGVPLLSVYEGRHAAVKTRTMKMFAMEVQLPA